MIIRTGEVQLVTVALIVVLAAALLRAGPQRVSLRGVSREFTIRPAEPGDAAELARWPTTSGPSPAAG